MENMQIAYQNKDITSKMLAENFKGKTFRVYGLDLPEIRQALTEAAQAYEEEKRQEIQNTSKQIVIRMIKKDYSSEEIAALVSTYSRNDVEALREEIAAKEI